LTFAQLAIAALAILPEAFRTGIQDRALAAGVMTLALALLAQRMRAVDLSGAAAGAVASFLLYSTSGLGAFITLGALFLLTAGATRFGAARKRRLGVAEARRGRTAWQVLANLSVATILSVASLYASVPELLLGAVAALAEAAADTVASEIGQALSARAYLVTTFRHVEVGAEGGISVVGSVSGVVAALSVALVAFGCQLIPARWIVAAAGAALIGMFLDSLLGATLQQRGWLSNSGVNVAGTLAAAVIAIAFLY
jgi:uncharacterized protein (TIGR00297 family)